MLSLYVNDPVIYIVRDEQDLKAVKVILVVFVCALGLHTNTGATARSRRPQILLPSLSSMSPPLCATAQASGLTREPRDWIMDYKIIENRSGSVLKTD
jgi:hypothetical protein